MGTVIQYKTSHEPDYNYLDEVERSHEYNMYKKVGNENKFHRKSDYRISIHNEKLGKMLETENQGEKSDIDYITNYTNVNLDVRIGVVLRNCTIEHKEPKLNKNSKIEKLNKKWWEK